MADTPDYAQPGMADQEGADNAQIPSDTSLGGDNPLAGSSGSDILAGGPNAPSPDSDTSALQQHTAQVAGTADSPGIGPRFKSALHGMLLGFASGGILGGVSGGIKGAIDPAHDALRQRQFDINQKNQQTQAHTQQQTSLADMQSVLAAEAHIRVNHLGNELDAKDLEDRIKANQDAEQFKEWYRQHTGHDPDFQLSGNGQEFHDNAIGLTNTMAAENDGKIPPAAVVFRPHTDTKPTFDADVYAPGKSDMDEGDSSWKKLVDTWSIITTGAPKDPKVWASENHMDRQNEYNTAINGLSPQIMTTTDGHTPRSASELRQQLSAEQQQLANYKKNPNADAGTVKQLQVRIDNLTQAAAAAQVNENKTAAEVSKQKAQAAGKLAEATGEKGLREAQATEALANAGNKGQEKMWEEGVNPSTGERLSIDNAPDDMLVDSRTGLPISRKGVTTLKPSQQESNRADFANSVLHTLDLIDKARASGKLPNGPIAGITAQGLSKAGLADSDAQYALNTINLARSAATGAHVGGRFNQNIMAKMNDMLSLNMNDSQMQGAEQSIRDVMTPYAKNGGRTTVAQYKAERITIQLPNGQQGTVPGAKVHAFITANPGARIVE